MSKRASNLLNRKYSRVVHVWKEYWSNEKVSVARPPANYSAKTTRIPRVSFVASLVQQFLYERRAIHLRTVAKDVMDLFARYNLIQVEHDSAKAVSAAVQSVRRYLHFLGYKRGRKRSSTSYRLREENVGKRDEYLSLMKHIITAREQRVVYLDESYVHHNYDRHDDSIFDPSDEQDIQIVVKHKGRRFCFIAAIVNADHSIDESAQSPNQQAFLIPETLDIFEGGKTQTKDYHGMFDSAYFEHWMRKILMALKVHGIENAVILLDNAKYHKRLPSDTPTGRTRKPEMQTKCDEYGIAFHKDELRGALWAKLKEYLRLHVSPVIVRMAEESGHTVLFTPPHHSDLQPIETVWAIVKGQVGHQYTTETTFQQVRNRLNTTFDDLKPPTVHGCIEKANVTLLSLHRQLSSMDDVESESDSDNECSDSADSGGESDE